MKKKNKKFSIFDMIGLLVLLYFMYLLIYVLAAGKGLNFATGTGVEYVSHRFDIVSNNPLSVDYFTKYTIPVCLLTSLLYVFGLITYRMAKREFRAGTEYGTSRWATPEEINKQLANKNEDMNLLLTNNTKIDIDPRTQLNRNILVIGGSGAGKTYRFVTPNLMQCNTSFIVTDPKGGCVEDLGEMLKKNGYVVKVLNLVDMKKSDGYNPFKYLRKDEDVVKLVSNIMDNTKPEDGKGGDPFWDDATSLFLQACFYYTWKCAEQYDNKPVNMYTFLDLVQDADSDTNKSELDKKMQRVRLSDPTNVAVRTYDKFMSGAEDTLRSIIISAHAKLFRFESPDLLRIFEADDMDFASIGMGLLDRGVRDEKTKTALFVVIPDDDGTYNFVVGMLYTQLFQELYHAAKQCKGNKLPIPVQIYLDEFANIAMPSNFLKIIATCRSRGIGCVPIVQNKSQIKGKYKDNEGTMIGNCDAIVYLGGNEPDSHKYIMELLGKETIYKRSQSVSRGSHGSTSNSTDVLGRELMDAAEIRMMDNAKSICLIRGQYPVYDDKIDPQKRKRIKETALGGGGHAKTYRHEPTPNNFIVSINDLSQYKDLNVEFFDVPLDVLLEYDEEKKRNDKQNKPTDLDQEFKKIDISSAQEALKTVVKTEMEENQNDLLSKLSDSPENLSLSQFLTEMVLPSSYIQQALEASLKGVSDEFIKKEILSGVSEDVFVGHILLKVFDNQKQNETN